MVVKPLMLGRNLKLVRNKKKPCVFLWIKKINDINQRSKPNLIFNNINVIKHK